MDVNLPGHRRHRGHPAAHRGPDGPVVVLLSTYDEDQFDLDGCGCRGLRRQGGLRARTGSPRPGPRPAADREHATGQRSDPSARVDASRPAASTRSCIACRSIRRATPGSVSTRSRRPAQVDAAAVGRARLRAAEVDAPPPPAARTAARCRRGRADRHRPASRPQRRLEPGPGQLGGEHPPGQVPQRLQRRVHARRPARSSRAGSPCRDRGPLAEHAGRRWGSTSREIAASSVRRTRVVGLDDPGAGPGELRGGPVELGDVRRPAGPPARCCGTRPRPGRRGLAAAARRRAQPAAPRERHRDAAQVAAVRPADRGAPRSRRRSPSPRRREAARAAASPSRPRGRRALAGRRGDRRQQRRRRGVSASRRLKSASAS